MLELKSIFASKTVLTNIAIGFVGILTAVGVLPDACNADNVAANLGVTVPALLGTVITGLAAISTFFRIRATAALV